MKLTITFQDYKNANALESILKCILDSDCQLAELRSLNLADINAGHLLINGNWNHIAKLESSLSILSQNYNIDLQMHRIEKPQEYNHTIPYLIETFALEKKDILSNLMAFFIEREITVVEISSSLYPAHHVNSSLLSSKFIIAIPEQQAIISLREEFLDYCDHLNIDAILEPIKSKIL